jgi:hypothetical protein
MPEADLGIHPSDKVIHSISFYCGDIHKTVEDLRSRGVEFSSGITDEGWGLLTHFRRPGNMEVELYQPSTQNDLLARSQGPRPQLEHEERAETASSAQ